MRGMEGPVDPNDPLRQGKGGLRCYGLLRLSNDNPENKSALRTCIERSGETVTDHSTVTSPPGKKPTATGLALGLPRVRKITAVQRSRRSDRMNNDQHTRDRAGIPLPQVQEGGIGGALCIKAFPIGVGPLHNGRKPVRLPAQSYLLVTSVENGVENPGCPVSEALR